MDTISNEKVKALLEEKMPNARIHVEGDGYQYKTTVINDDFNGEPTVKRHMAVYAALNTAITSGALHALVLKTYTTEEWQELQKPES